MNTQPEAERLADRLDLWGDQGDLMEAAAELRRLSESNAELLEAIKAELAIEWYCNSYHPKLIAAFAKHSKEQA
jgi:hypothetical protein